MELNKAKVNVQHYTNCIQKRLIPSCLKMYPGNDYYFMQEGAISELNYATTFSKQHFTVDSSRRRNGHLFLLILTFWIIIFGMQYRSVFTMV